ncbi:hypothetical protein [Rhodococcus sp. LB1]|nr:hypothetical protein [Rhodococcus sp. LB1]
MTPEEIDEWVANVGPAPDDVFAKIVAVFRNAELRDEADRGTAPTRSDR